MSLLDKGSIKCKEKYYGNEPVEYCCEDCKVCICHKCGATVRNHHNKKDIEHASDDIKNQMPKMITKLKAKAVSVEAKVKEQTNLMLNSQDEILHAEREMVKVVEETIPLSKKFMRNVILGSSAIWEARQAAYEAINKQYNFEGQKVRVLLLGIPGSEILESECAAVLSGFEIRLNSEEMEIYNPTYLANKGSYKEKRLLGDIVILDPHSPAPVLKNPLPYVLSYEGCPIRSKGIVFLGSDRVIKFKSGSRSVVVSGITGKCYVAEPHKRRIQLFGSEGKCLGTIGDKGTGEEIMDRPNSVAFTSSGNIFVVENTASPGRSKLSVFTERGHYITNISNHLLYPRSVSDGKDGNLLACESFTVKVLSLDGTKLIQTNEAPYCDERPYFAVYHQGMFSVSNESLHCVEAYNNEGQILYKIGCKGSGDGQLRNPRGLVKDKFNNIVVCDLQNGRFHIFSLEGKFLNSVTKDFSRSQSVAVAKNGEVLLCPTINCLYGPA